MKLFTSTTSPFARIVRILLKEKQLAYEEVMLDPWTSPAELLNVSPACTVPVLRLTNGIAISNSLLIVQYLESTYPTLPLPVVSVEELSTTSLAFSLLEAFAAIIIGRRALEDFDNSPVGLRRRRTLVKGLMRLNVNPPKYVAGVPSLACIVTTVLLDAIRFRFSNADWIPNTSGLDLLSIQLNARSSFSTTRPM